MNTLMDVLCEHGTHRLVNNLVIIVPVLGDVARYYLCGIITEDEDETGEMKLEQSTEGTRMKCLI